MIKTIFVLNALFFIHTTSLAMVSSFGSSVTFQPNDSEATIRAKGGPSVTVGNTTIYTGYRQVSAINQDPIIASFTNGNQDWVITDYDTSPTDARGIGLGWDVANNRLYAAFTTDGGASASAKHTRFNDAGRMDNGWQRSYGSGGGSKATVIYELDPGTGRALSGTYLISKLSNGNTNTIIASGFDWHDSQLVVYADSYFTPLNPDKSRMSHNGGSSPFEYRGIFSADLSSLNSAEAIGFNGITSFNPLTGSENEGTVPAGFLRADAFPLGSDWYWNDWLGTYFMNDTQWIYHLNYGWIFADTEGNSASGAWLYLHANEGWYWMSDTLGEGFSFSVPQNSMVYWDTSSRQWWPF